MDFEKIIEELKTEITSLKIRVQGLEKFILSQPEPRKYIKGNIFEPDYGGLDSLFDEAKDIAQKFDEVSASHLQRRLSIGYSRAARIIDQLEEKGILGPGTGSKPRKVIK